MAVGTTFRLSFDGQTVQQGIASVSKSIARMGTDIASSLLRPFAQLTAMLAPAALVGGMVSFGKAASEAAATIENMRAQFDLFTGSSNGTEKLIKDLRKIAVESPLELSSISEGARMLLTYGVAAEKVAPIISQLSEVSAGSAERFERISYAFGQIESIGRLMGTELRQLTEAGFNPLEFISKKTGETMMQLKKRMEDGGVGIDEVRESLKAATSEGGRFFGMNQKMAQTFTGRVSMMKDQWSQLLQGFGSGMNDGLKVAVNAITASLPQFLEKFQTIGKYFGQAISDAVYGDFDKFIAIGDLIGTAIKVGVVSAFQAASGEILNAMAGFSKEWNSKIPLPVNQMIAKGAGMIQGMEKPGFKDLLDANAMNAGLSGKAQSVMQGNQGLVPGTNGKFRFAGPDESSSLRDASGNKVVEVLKKIEQNTSGGAKF